MGLHPDLDVLGLHRVEHDQGHDFMKQKHIFL